jgi:cysteine synthase
VIPSVEGCPKVTARDVHNMVERAAELARRPGHADISTGVNVGGTHRLAERLGPDAVIVTLAVDTGFKYLSGSPYDDF